MATLKRLPIGIQAFETIQQNNYIYVDKTKYIYRMIDEGMFYFLSRPRRFGKSLLVSTIKCLFEAKKELFQNLWIGKNKNWQWKKHPIILIDFNGVTHDTSTNLQISLERNLIRTAISYDITLNEPLLKDKFIEIIIALYKKTQTPVVVLIDEYDKPIIDHLGKGEKAIQTAIQNRDILKSFFGVLKEGTLFPLLRFVFITGVSKFSRVSIFSELNNLFDITMHEQYCDMLGYTQKELEICFNEYIQKAGQKFNCSVQEIKIKLTKKYNGYRFSEKDTKVYNPFSILGSLNELKFKNYWFETGTPTFLINLIHEKNYNIPKIENLELTESIFSNYEIDNLKIEALLFQTGYITIKDVDEGFYTFDYPNDEVKLSFIESLLLSYTKEVSGEKISKFKLLSRYLKKEDFESFFETIISIFASIPYTLNTKRDEAYFHTLFYLMVSASGADAISEVLTSRGRIDLAVEFLDKIFLMEFKCNQSAEAGLKQINEKGYATKYKQTGKKIFLIGINFDTDKRNITEWKVN